MSTQTLTSVAMNVVGQYNQAGKQLVRAWRAGTERAVGAVNERFASAVNARTLPFVTDDVKASLIDAQQQVAGIVAYGLGLPATGADLTIDQVARRVHNGIERISDTTARVESAFGTSALDKVGVFAMPVAYVSLELANVVAQGSKRLSERVAGDEVASPPRPGRPRRSAFSARPAADNPARAAGRLEARSAWRPQRSDRAAPRPGRHLPAVLDAAAKGDAMASKSDTTAGKKPKSRPARKAAATEAAPAAPAPAAQVGGAKGLLRAGLKALNDVRDDVITRQSRVFEALLGIDTSQSASGRSARGVEAAQRRRGRCSRHAEVRGSVRPARRPLAGTPGHAVAAGAGRAVPAARGDQRTLEAHRAGPPRARTSPAHQPALSSSDRASWWLRRRRETGSSKPACGCSTSKGWPACRPIASRPSWASAPVTCTTTSAPRS